MANKITNTAYYQDIADAIRTKNGKKELYTPPQMANAILTLPSKDTKKQENDIIFIDYDGTIVESYTKDEFLALEQMPDNPDHEDEGLTAEGWNWTLEDAKAFLALPGMRYMTIGQTYTTTDGKHHIVIEIPEQKDRKTEQIVTVSIPVITLGSGAMIDWGDGTSAEALYAGANTHTYYGAGKFTIKIYNDSSSSSSSVIGGSSSAYNILGVSVNSNPLTYLVKAVHIAGDNGITFKGGFKYLFELEALTISKDYHDENRTSSLASTFNTTLIKSLILGCPYESLESFYDYFSLNASGNYNNHQPDYISFPQSICLAGYLPSSAFLQFSMVKRFDTPIKILPYNTFYNAYFLEHVTLKSDAIINGNVGSIFYNSGIEEIIVPDTITLIPTSFCAQCYRLNYAELPATITEIKASAFQNCNQLRELHIKATTPPVLENTNALSGAGTNSVLRIYVPAESVEAYKAATNWATYADNIVAEVA